MPTQAINPEDLTTEQQAELGDKMKLAQEERYNRERAEQALVRQRREARAKLQRVESELTKVRADEDVKVRTVAYLRERLEGVEELHQGDPDVRAERLALVEAIDMATNKGAPVTSGINCPSNAREYRLLFDGAPRGTAWSVPIAELQRRRQALTEERDRLRETLELGEEDATATAAA